MLPLTFADIAEPSVVSPNDPVAFAAVFLGVILVEGIALRVLRWGGWGRCFLASIVINSVTGAIGVPAAWLTSSIYGLMPVVAWFLLAFLATVAVEALLLKALKRSAPWRTVLVNSLVINVCSYALLAILAFVLASRSPRTPRWRVRPVPPLPTPDLHSPTPQGSPLSPATP